MKFGSANISDDFDYSLPKDGSNTSVVLGENQDDKDLKSWLGLPKWGKADIQNFYPKGCKNPLYYYSTQFNAVEFNAFFYRIFKPEQVVKWRENVAEGFKFFPKIPQIISQFRRLKDVDHLVDEFLFSINHFEDKLGTCFLQMHPTFSPENFNNLKTFIEKWPLDVPLAVELRHADWYHNLQVNNSLIALLQEHDVAHVITDTIGRRDLLHMQLTNSNAFVRFTAANNEVDVNRVDEWVVRLSAWKEMGLKELCFFAHIQAEKENPFILARFANEMNRALNLHLPVPGVQQI